MATRKTWKQLIGKRLLAHVRQTTERSTLAEVRNNHAYQTLQGIRCSECIDIIRKVNK